MDGEQSLINNLENFDISEPHSLPFNPIGDRAWVRDTFTTVPRFLYRLSTPRCACLTTSTYVQSVDARKSRESSSVDVFARLDDAEAAVELNRHFRWKGREGDSDNFVSWTSSLLYAIQGILYRRNYRHDGSRYEDIQLCVVDTSRFPKGIFVQDLTLLEVYAPFDEGLADYKQLRSVRDAVYSGTHYFGEYLSQGSLEVSGNIRMVSARTLLDHGIMNLHPDFHPYRHADWVRDVMRLRQPFVNASPIQKRLSTVEVEAAFRAGELFGEAWRLPITVSFLSLYPWPNASEAILSRSGPRTFTDLKRFQYSPASRISGTHVAMPELQCFAKLMREIFTHSCLSRAKESLKDAELALQLAATTVGNSSFAAETPTVSRIPRFEDLFEQLNMQHALGRCLHEIVLERVGLVELPPCTSR